MLHVFLVTQYVTHTALYRTMRNFVVATLLHLQLLFPGSSVTRWTLARPNGAFSFREAWQISHSLSIATICYLDIKYHVNKPISFEHTHQIRTALIWSITQRVVLIPYRRFGKPISPNFSWILYRRRWDRHVVPKCR